MERNFLVWLKRSGSLFFIHAIFTRGDIGCIGVPVAAYISRPSSDDFNSLASFLPRLSAQVIAFPKGTPFLSTASKLCIDELKQIQLTLYFLGLTHSLIRFLRTYSIVINICSGSCSL